MAKVVVDEAYVQGRVDARILANKAIELAMDELLLLPEAARGAFHETLREYADCHLPPLPPIVPATARREMTDREAREFENELMPFGIHSGKTINQLMGFAEGRAYLLWLSRQRFIDLLRLYLARSDVQDDLQADMPDEAAYG